MDRVGLALSGGGIRSATFNLGLLQALNSYGILGQVDYLSTVSGGGYIGGWWTAWRARPAGGGAIFPGSGTVADPRSHPDAEPPEVRHLREFSNFLSPRWGFFQSEMWNSLLAVMGGLVPALMVALSCLGLVLFLWLAMTAYLAGPSTPFALGLFCGIAAVVLSVREFRWRRMGKADPTSTGAATAIALSAVGVAAVGAAWLIWFRSLQSVSGLEWPLYFDGFWRTHARAWSMDAWLSAIGAVAEHDRWHLNPRLFEGAFVWLAVGLILLPLRLLFQSIRSDELRRKAIPAIDRVMERFLGLGIGWALVALIWTAGSNLHTVGPVKIGTALAAAGSAGLFAWLRRWLVSSFGSARTGGFMETLKPLIPQVLAYVTVILMGVIVAGVSASWLEWMQDDPMRWMMVLGTMSIVVLVSMLLDPAEFGLHAFYRNRIARAYLGASNPAARGPASENRQTDLRRGDDLPFEQARLRPLHLVCCAANDLAGDRLSNLSRGARSATLSCHGLAIGDDWAGKPGLRLGSAVTASAAAFNSSMGSISARLGPAVAFLMSALNLRLGLWARHPLSRSLMRDRVPGLLFLQEMAGHTHAGTRMTPRGREPLSRFVHLSDGGHFENLALYELVRRHCRYIIVSDCGADPGVLFDDLGNAVRRIREDFGVEIEIDVGPLRPGPDGISRQHMVVGAIRYTPEDHGILLLFKPALTGDEPTDVQQYKSRNRAFPHESTGD
ncbi:MAG TPA: hypothetical protein VFP98_04800, partial [Candidatus Polarisedimenticolia bacterium]|nr:hypothetical protein [Candidatus Polarisedimenticolia bacterium]